MELSRRVFVRLASAGTLAAYAAARSGPIALAAIPGGTLDPAAVPKFAVPLLIPPAMPGRDIAALADGSRVDTYEISVRQIEQQMLPGGWPTTTVWAFGPLRPDGSTDQHHAPSHTIEAQQGRPVRITWVNALVDSQGRFLPHLLPVDPSLHWANPLRRPGHGEARTDTRPDLTGLTYVPPSAFTDPSAQYTAYDGPVPWVTHLHGAMGLGDESDGYPEAWYLPPATNLPSGISANGRWRDFFVARFAAKYGVKTVAGQQLSHYPNDNRASTLWFHDHTLGMTRLNVYAGPAGFFLLREGKDGAQRIRDTRRGQGTAVLPGPAPAQGDASGTRYYEIPLAIQDRSFTADGSLFYPDSRAFFDETGEPYYPASDVAPIWTPEFFGNTIIVNGRTWPYLETEQRRYRFRVLNGCNSRALILDLSAVPGVDVWQIGNDGGFLPAPFHVTGGADNRVLLGPAERADLIVDFTRVPLGEHVLRNVGPDDPFGGGDIGVDFDPADPDGTGQVMQFRVVPIVGVDNTTPPENLSLPKLKKLPKARSTRRLALIEQMSTTAEDAPVAALLGTVTGDPTSAAGATASSGEWMDAVTENPATGASEVWEIYNLTADAHPIHLHEVAFTVLGRQDITVGEAPPARDDGHLAMTGAIRVAPGSVAMPPESGEEGRKDTVLAYPGQVTRLHAHFRTAGRFVWHCHVLEHEDNEMMRPLQVGRPEPGQPS